MRVNFLNNGPHISCNNCSPLSTTRVDFLSLKGSWITLVPYINIRGSSLHLFLNGITLKFWDYPQIWGVGSQLGPSVRPGRTFTCDVHNVHV
jgi:hypothetical protein